jgi:probable HAF family extracellular repeat protein
MKHLRFTSVLVLASAIIAVSTALAEGPRPPKARTYQLTNLGTLGGDFNSAGALNNLGHATGTSTTAKGETHAYIWADHDITDLGTLGGPHNFSNGEGINDRDQIVGSSDLTADVTHAFKWERGNMADLGALSGYSNSDAIGGINNAGDVTGNSFDVDAQGKLLSHATLWKEDGRIIDLGTLGGRLSISRAINSSGQIVGSADTADGQSHGFLWEDGTMKDLGTLGGDQSDALFITDEGIVLGFSNTANNIQHDFIWVRGVMFDLSLLTGFGDTLLASFDVNARHQAVAVKLAADDRHALLFDNFRIFEINTLIQCRGAVNVNDVSGINNKGQILASELKFTPLFTPHAFLLTPTKDDDRARCDLSEAASSDE